MAGMAGREGGGHGFGDGVAFAALVHRALVRERRRPMRDVAAALGLSYAAFHARVSGRVPFSPAEVSRLLHELPDMRLADCLLRHTRFVAFERPSPSCAAEAGGALAVAAMAMEALAGLVAGLALAAEADGVDPMARLEEVQRAVAALAFVLPQHVDARRRAASRAMPTGMEARATTSAP
ncbi:MAG: hypothetical protein FJX69_12060 [Alphaproteobacteria bacterium]|nr:hypothetical protein [Alphaproteobacteria bacterium]MBM3630127.1 hypothetical protein [Alphaproteobacteria bacterium]